MHTEASEGLPMRQLIDIPSCVPAALDWSMQAPSLGRPR